MFFKYMNDELINELIEVIWPFLDAGMSKGEIECAFTNAVDSWERSGGCLGRSSLDTASARE